MADEKRQIIHRLPVEFVRQTLADFNSGSIAALQACQLLNVGKTRLYELRTLWLKDRQAFTLEASGGNQRGRWPECAVAFLREFVPLQTPPNYQLVADELLRLHGLRRARSSVEANRVLQMEIGRQNATLLPRRQAVRTARPN